MFFCATQWARYLAERYNLLFSHARSISSYSFLPTDLPTLQPRVDSPQSCRGGNHNRGERSGGLVYGRKTAREALEGSETGPNLQADRSNLMLVEDSTHSGKK